MIVQCDKCRTKFRIGDEKVSENGVKVRCSRCAHVFMVKRDPSAGTAVPSTSEVDRALSNVGLGLGADGMPASTGLPSFPSYTPTVPTASPANAHDVAVALGFAPGPAPVPDGNIPADFSYDEDSSAATVAFNAAQLLPPERPERGMSFDDLGQARFPPPALGSQGLGAPPITTFEELFGGKEAPTQVSQLPPLAGLESNTSPGGGGLSGPAFDALRSSPFDIPRSNPSLDQLRSNPSMQSPISPPTPAPQPKSNPALAALAAAEVGIPAEMTSPFFPPPTGIPGLSTNTNLQAIFQQHGEKNGGGMESGDIPGLIPPGAASDDPFAGLDLEGPGYSGGDLSEADPLDETRAVGPLNGEDPVARPLAKIDLGRAGVGSQFESNLATTRVASSLLKEGAPHRDGAADPELAEPRDRWPTLVGLAAGVLITLVAVIGPAGGDLRSLGPDDLAALISTPISEPIDSSVQSVEAKSSQVTLYPGKGGKMLLVIVGEAFNDGDQRLVGVEAVAVVRRGGDAVEQRESWLGLMLPEDALSAIATKDELELALVNAMRAEKEPIDQRALGPGESLPFMVVFPDPPADVANHAFHVEFRRGSVSARRAQ